MQVTLSKKQKIIILITGLNIFLIAFLFSIINQEKQLKVVFFDVGQGSSIFIQTPNRKQVLIDGGPDSLLILEHLGKNMPFWDRSIDIVISTHSDSSHITGLIEVLKRYKIGKIIWAGMETDSLTHQQFKQELEKAEKRGTEIVIAQFGQKFQLEEEIYLKVLNPSMEVEKKDQTDLNNNSIVTRLSFNKIFFLFTSDIEKERELLLAQKNKLLKEDFLSADILKIPHHGSRTSSNYEFLKAINPTTAIIQVGDNRFDHPHQSVINRLKERELNIFRTDLNGIIKIISDGERYEIVTTKK